MKRLHIDKIFQTLGLVAIFLGFVLLGILIYWFYFPHNVIDYPNEPFPVEQLVYNRGERVGYHIEWCKFKPLPARSELLLIPKGGGEEYSLSQKRNSNVETGCGSANTTTPVIPEDVRPAEYKLRFEVKYSVNPIKQNFLETAESEYFVIE